MWRFQTFHLEFPCIPSLPFPRTKILYVESVCRVETLSLSAKILQYFAHETYVQWPELEKKFPRTKYVARFV